MVRLAVRERAVCFALRRDPFVLAENAQDLHLRIARHEEAAHRREQLVDDLVPALRDAGARDALARRFPAAVDVDLRPQRFQISRAQSYEERAAEPLVARLCA